MKITAKSIEDKTNHVYFENLTTGVYKFADKPHNNHLRIIVQPGFKMLVALSDNSATIMDESWSNSTFQKVNEKITIEFE